MRVAELGAAACRRAPGPAGGGQRHLLPGAGGGRGQRLDQGPRHLDAGADGARRPTCCRRASSPRCRRRGRARRARISAAASFASAPPASAYGLGWRILDYAGHRVIGHHGGVRGYRSMILFDPRAAARAWSCCGTRRARAPTAIEYEVMDMVYRLDRPRLARARQAAGARAGRRRRGERGRRMPRESRAADRAVTA